MTIWILTVGCLFLIFIFRSIQKMRRETGDSKILEIGNENNIYDELRKMRASFFPTTPHGS